MTRDRKSKARPGQLSGETLKTLNMLSSCYVVFTVRVSIQPESALWGGDCFPLREAQLPRGTSIVDSSTNSVIAWIKCGPNVSIDEARTRHWTTNALREAGVADVQAARAFHAFTAEHYGCSIGYIAMEYIDGMDCGSNDVDLAAKAVQALIGLRAPPTATIGHIGGGTKSIVHSFFPEWLPSVDYRTDKDFYDHIHNVDSLQMF